MFFMFWSGFDVNYFKKQMNKCDGDEWQFSDVNNEEDIIFEKDETKIHVLDILLQLMIMIMLIMMMTLIINITMMMNTRRELITIASIIYFWSICKLFTS